MIVGVVGEVRKQDLATPPPAMLYRPQGVPINSGVQPGPPPCMVLVVKSSAAVDEVVTAIRQIVRDLDPTVPVFDVKPMSEMAAPFLRAFLYGVTATDPLTLAGATLVLVATACLASWLPARQAARVDPAAALRAE